MTIQEIKNKEIQLSHYIQGFDFFDESEETRAKIKEARAKLENLRKKREKKFLESFTAPTGRGLEGCTDIG